MWIEDLDPQSCCTAASQAPVAAPGRRGFALPDRSGIERLDLDVLTVPFIDSTLAPRYRKAGLDVIERGVLSPPSPAFQPLRPCGPQVRTKIRGLIRQYVPKRTSMKRVTQDRCNAIASALNNRPRKRHGFRTPLERLAEYFDVS